MSRLPMSDIYFISYDIAGNKLRGKIEKTLKNYGFRVQYSIFQCVADKEKITKAISAVENVMKLYERFISKNDSVMVIGGVAGEKIRYILGEEPNLAQYLIY